jgi:hypothetical protein
MRGSRYLTEHISAKGGNEGLWLRGTMVVKVLASSAGSNVKSAHYDKGKGPQGSSCCNHDGYSSKTKIFLYN